jgi:hypothetical protein
LIRIAHIINPVKAAAGSELFVAQPITFETMVKAKAFAEGQVEVQLFTTQYPEDHEIIPADFNKTPDLERSVNDLATFQRPKKLPLLKDILEHLYNATDAEWLVYTNVDIAVMPFFYVAIADMIKQGHDAFAINRRRVSGKYDNVNQIPLMYADIGRPHPGFDCFVFHRKLFPKFQLGYICIGIPFIEATMIYNLVAFSENFRLFYDQHLTIHIGLEVMPARDNEYYWHNRREFNKLLKEVKPHLKAKNLPYAELSLIRKVINWGLNPGIFVGLNTDIEAKGFLNRLRFRLNEIRFRILQRY